MLPPFGSDGHFKIGSPLVASYWKASTSSNVQQQASSSSSAEDVQAKPPRLRLPQSTNHLRRERCDRAAAERPVDGDIA
jgi:hypothetical protein